MTTTTNRQQFFGFCSRALTSIREQFRKGDRLMAKRYAVSAAEKINEAADELAELAGKNKVSAKVEGLTAADFFAADFFEGIALALDRSEPHPELANDNMPDWIRKELA